MTILHRYITQNIIVSFLIGLLVYTFISFMGNMIKIADLLIKGVDPLSIAKLFLLFMPYLLTICMPMALLTAVLLVFGRLSRENEITALRSCGVSILRFVSPIILLGIFVSIFCIILNNKIVPFSHYSARKLLFKVGMTDPVRLLTPGSFIELFPNHIIHFRAKNENKLKNVLIYQTTEKGQMRTINAKQGIIRNKPDKNELSIELINGNIQEPKEGDFKDFFNLSFGSYTITLPVSKMGPDSGDIAKKHKDMTIDDLKEKIIEYKQLGINITPYTTEIQKKISLSFSCLVFVLIGIPLGIITHRTEKTVGAGISLLLVTVYYLFIVFGKALDETPAYHPELLMWLPNIVIGGIGIFLLRRVIKL